MASRVSPLRALLSVGAVSIALGLTLVSPADAATSPPRAVSAPIVSAPVLSAATVSGTAVVAPRTVGLPTLSSGARGTYVKRVQRMLGIPVTGVYGRRTTAAVIRFQKAHHLRVTGRVNTTTWRAIIAYWRAHHTAVPAAAAPPAVDPTTSAAARASKSARIAVGFAAWQTSPHGRYISRRESHNVCSVVSSNGAWRGKWQMTMTLWRGYGGTAFASTPERATCLEQDKVAYKVWIAQWWRPWGG
jgi:hypothetical protein